MSNLKPCPRCENIERLWSEDTMKLCKEIDNLRAEVERLRGDGILVARKFMEEIDDDGCTCNTCEAAQRLIALAETETE